MSENQTILKICEKDLEEKKMKYLEELKKKEDAIKKIPFKDLEKIAHRYSTVSNKIDKNSDLFKKLVSEILEEYYKILCLIDFYNNDVDQSKIISDRTSDTCKIYKNIVYMILDYDINLIFCDLNKDKIFKIIMSMIKKDSMSYYTADIIKYTSIIKNNIDKIKDKDKGIKYFWSINEDIFKSFLGIVRTDYGYIGVNYKDIGYIIIKINVQENIISNEFKIFIESLIGPKFKPFICEYLFGYSDTSTRYNVLSKIFKKNEIYSKKIEQSDEISESNLLLKKNP
jgi:hypothetical protein